MCSLTFADLGNLFLRPNWFNGLLVIIIDLTQCLPRTVVTSGFICSSFEAPTGQLYWSAENWLLDSYKLMFGLLSISQSSLACNTLIIFQSNRLHREMRQSFYTPSGIQQRGALRGDSHSQRLYLFAALIRGQMLTTEQQRHSDVFGMSFNPYSVRVMTILQQYMSDQRVFVMKCMPWGCRAVCFLCKQQTDDRYYGSFDIQSSQCIKADSTN